MKTDVLFRKKSTAGVYTKEGENICPPSKIIYMKYHLINILLGRMFLTWKQIVMNIYKYNVKTIFENKHWKHVFKTSKMSVQTWHWEQVINKW